MSRTPTASIHSIPPEVFDYAILARLSPSDLSRVSRTCRALRDHIQALPPAYWIWRLRKLNLNMAVLRGQADATICAKVDDNNNPDHAKSAFLRCWRAKRFGPPDFVGPNNDELWLAPTVRAAKPHKSFLRGRPFGMDHSGGSVSIWLRCAPPRDAVGSIRDYRGGIVLGYQDRNISDLTSTPSWPHYHWQVLSVNMEGHLLGAFESSLHDHINSGRRVDDGLWHHALLSGRNDGQDLYLDGVHVGSIDSPASGQYVLQHMQVGSGVVSGETQGTPQQPWAGPFPFSGWLMDLRVYENTVGPEEVKALFDKGEFKQQASLSMELTEPFISV
ncbi:hypothetical protein HK101_003454 [Irineochytrium annulatum]|nr:hypothetical protein HK101_003454 [Irineochytrium annulatum]